MYPGLMVEVTQDLESWDKEHIMKKGTIAQILSAGRLGRPVTFVNHPGRYGHRYLGQFISPVTIKKMTEE